MLEDMGSKSYCRSRSRAGEPDDRVKTHILLLPRVRPVHCAWAILSSAESIRFSRLCILLTLLDLLFAFVWDVAVTAGRLGS